MLIVERSDRTSEAARAVQRAMLVGRNDEKAEAARAVPWCRK